MERFKREALQYYQSIEPRKAPERAEDVMSWVRDSLEKNLRSCSPRNNAIVRVEVAREPHPAGVAELEDLGLEGGAAPVGRMVCFELVGVDAKKREPLWVFMGFQAHEVGLMLKMAKGKNARDIGWEERGTGPDNTIILAMLLLLAIGIYFNGYGVITNDPVDEARRRLYRFMGFEDGRVLRLTDEQSMKKIIGFVGAAVEGAGLDPMRLVYRAKEA
ncbi:MAG: hypothetical protein A3G41_06935 [Elusimicrobia bacterium RIFCSPLOWO2_12_FULL_59_9]|nr:MAG: hypothetical protein A3G41_06935 [Elusimicrobia bacterium RIFCSPLOWO2_12_FULL_59_9]